MCVCVCVSVCLCVRACIKADGFVGGWLGIVRAYVCMYVSVCNRVRVDYCAAFTVVYLSFIFLSPTLFLSSVQAFYRWRYNTLRKQQACRPQSLLAALRHLTRARAQVGTTTSL